MKMKNTIKCECHTFQKQTVFGSKYFKSTGMVLHLQFLASDTWWIPLSKTASSTMRAGLFSTGGTKSDTSLNYGGPEMQKKNITGNKNREYWIICWDSCEFYLELTSQGTSLMTTATTTTVPSLWSSKEKIKNSPWKLEKHIFL